MWRVILGRDIERNLSGSKGVTMDNFSISLKGWWKMAISHLKHSYLNWRAISYKKQMICVYVVFFNTFFEFDFLDFCLDSVEFFKCMTWQSIFLFILLFIHFFLFFEWSILGNVTCRGWPSSLKHLFSYEDRFGRVGFWFEVAHIISVQRKNMAQKYSREMGNFWSMCPEASIKVISECHDFGTFISSYCKGLVGLKL